MAYSGKYFAGANLFSCQGDNIEAHLIILKKDYTGDIIDVKLRNNTFKLNREWQSLDDPILGVNIEFEVMNVGSDCGEEHDFFAYKDLLTATERQFKVIIELYEFKQYHSRLFEGYINVDNSQLKYLKYQGIRLVASSYLSKLQHYSTVELETIQGLTFIDYISSMLRELGSEDDIRINSSLLPVEDWGIQNITPGNPGFTLFNKTGAVTELFWENNVERESSYDILLKIMESFNCYIYWWDSKWYIERYNNIWGSAVPDKYFVEYDINAQYSPQDNGVWTQETKRVYDVHELTFAGMTQKLSSIPGYRVIAVKINNKKFDNLVSPTFSPFTTVEDGNYIPSEYRKWYGFQTPPGDTTMRWFDVDKPYNDIEFAIRQQVLDVTYYFTGHGLYTRFLMTIKADETSLSLKWKYNVGDNWVQNGTDAVTFIQWYNLWFENEGSHKYLSYREDRGWYLDNASGNASLEHHFAQPDFNQDTHTYEVNINIPLKDLNKTYNPGGYPIPYEGDVDLRLGIGQVWRYANVTPQVLDGVYFGDVEVKSQGTELDPNYIEGTINTDFLNKKVFEMTLADQSDLTYKNGILRGSTLLQRTTLWQAFDGDAGVPLIDRLLEDKFRFYNVVRLQIQGNAFPSHLDGFMPFWRPFTLFQDSKQGDMKYILVGLQYRIDMSMYDLILLEYDNETDVNLIG